MLSCRREILGRGSTAIGRAEKGEMKWNMAEITRDPIDRML